MAGAVKIFKADNVTRSSLVYETLVKRLTIIDIVTVESDMASSGNFILEVYEDDLCPSIGDKCPYGEAGDMYAISPIIVSPVRGTDGFHPNDFEITTVYEGTTNTAYWTSNGGMVQEEASLDHKGKPTVVPPPTTLTAEQLQTLKYQPKVVRRPRWRGQNHRTCVFYVAQPNGKSNGDFAYADQLQSMVGTTNDGNWGNRDTSPARTWLWARTEISTNNNVLFRVEVDFVYRLVGWDEVGLWLDGNGNVLMNKDGTVAISPAIPSPEDFAASNTGLSQADGGGGGAVGGWRRFIMTNQAPWQNTFDLDTSEAPDLSNLASSTDIH